MPLPTRGNVLGGFLRLGMSARTGTLQNERGKDEVSPSYLKGAPPLVMPLFLKTDRRIRATTANPTAQVAAQPERNDMVTMQCLVGLSTSQVTVYEWKCSEVWCGVDQLEGKMSLDQPCEGGTSW